RLRTLRDPMFRTSLAFALAGFIGCFPRPDVAHIAFAAPLACPLLAYCTSRIIASWPRRYRYALAALAISLSIPSASVLSYFAYLALQEEPVATPRGHAAFLYDDGTREMMARIVATPSSDSYFFYPNVPMLPFLTSREHVSKYEIFYPGYTTPSQ